MPHGRAQQAPPRRRLGDAVSAAPSPAEHLENVNETIDEMRPRAAHVRRTRRALRRAHRPFRLSLTVGMASGFVLLQLVALLWLKGLALTARNRADVLDRKIAEISGEIAKTEDAVAKLSSPPQIKQWAEELGMRPVTQADIDDVRQRTPLPATVMPDGSLPANTSGKARQKEDER
jgi:cell division protein FtsL